MKETIGAIVLVTLVVLGLAFGGLWMTGYFAPRYEAIRRDVMIQSRAYSEGTQRELYRLKLQYEQAQTDAEKATIRAMVIHEAEAVDRSRLPADIQIFIQQIGG